MKSMTSVTSASEIKKIGRWSLPNCNLKVEKNLPGYFRQQIDNYKNWHDKVLGINDDGLTHLRMDLKRIILWRGRRSRAVKPLRSKSKNLRDKIVEIISDIMTLGIMTSPDPVIQAFKELIIAICDQKYFDDELTDILRTLLFKKESEVCSTSEEGSNKENESLDVSEASDPTSTYGETKEELSSVLRMFSVTFIFSKPDSATPAATPQHSAEVPVEIAESSTSTQPEPAAEEEGNEHQNPGSSEQIRNGRSVWLHLPRLTEEEEEELCYVCRSPVGADENEPLLQCSKKVAGAKCTTRFHYTCARNYNAGEFNLDYMKTLIGNYVCPLHHCDLCWFERKKNTATLGRVLECSQCYRAFHDLCRPAGSSVTKQVRQRKAENNVVEYNVDTVVCHIHTKDPFKKQNAKGHLPFCCECEERGENPLIPCSQCIRSYHWACRRVERTLGNRYDESDPLCESCIHGESIRVNQFLIAKFNNGFFACTSVALNDYPAHCKAKDKYGHKLNEPGFLAVKWAGCANLFSLLPAQNAVPMFSGSFELIGKKKKDKDYIEAWKLMDDKIYTPRPVFNVLNDKYTKIRTSAYHADCPKPRLQLVQEEEVMCDCPPGEDRCGPKSKCQNRSTHQECPESCERVQGGCQNRCISRKAVNPGIVSKATELKGTGVFATATLPEGAFIAEYAGEIISLTEKQRRIDQSAQCKNDEEKHYMMQLDKNRVIDCKYKGNVARFLNHSCDPNCIVESMDVVVSSNGMGKGSSVRYDRRVAIFTRREISVGEELCFNYDMQEYSVGTPLPECRCESSNCTGKLGRTEYDRREKKARPPPAEPEDKVKRPRKRAVSPGASTGSQSKRSAQINNKKPKKLDEKPNNITKEIHPKVLKAGPIERIRTQGGVNESDCESIVTDDTAPSNAFSISSDALPDTEARESCGLTDGMVDVAGNSSRYQLTPNRSL
ncbi:unnamed protein product [Auanema sp. JU1783]|nr:unnamed protein product [Auanema sp. JU1783]